MMCALLIGSVRAYSLYTQSEHQFADTLTAIASVYVQQLAILVWDIEPGQLQTTLRGMVEHNDNIAYAKLDLLAGRQFEFGHRANAGNFAPRTFTLYEPGTSNHVIGQLQVYPSAKDFYEKMLLNVGLSLLGYLLLTILICQLVRGILRRHLQKPLKEIATFARTLDAEKLLVPLQLSNRENAIPNEIDVVVAGFNVLQAELSRHIHELDDIVAARTAQLEDALSDIQKLYITDQLTGCYNRHYLNNQLELILGSEAQQPVSLIFCDIDFFKRINDTFGHKAGDEVLTAIGRILRDALRNDSDWVARYGGEEFLIVLPKTELKVALLIAERLRSSIEQTQFQFREQPCQVTSSFGVAQQQANETAQQVCERADRLLYLAKRGGRNRVCS